MTASCPETNRTPAILEIEDLSVEFRDARAAPVRAIERVSLSVERGACVAVIGPSGSGKSTLVRVVLGLIPRGAVVRGRVRFDGRDILAMRERDRRVLRGKRIGYVGQDSYAAFDPLFRVGFQMREALRVHRAPGAAREVLQAALARVGLRPETLRKYPHELSGGMLQRLQVATALLHRPALMVADEPTSALDPIRRAEVTALLKAVRETGGPEGGSLLLITHDLALAAELADRVLFLSEGRCAGSGPADRFFVQPAEGPVLEMLRASRRVSGFPPRVEVRR